MNNYNCRYFFKRVAVYGTVCYENGSPVKNAIVFLEAFFPCKCYRFPKKIHRKCCGYTTTNFNGEFCFILCEIRCYYKIKIFDNEGINMDGVNCNVHLDQY